MPEQLLTADWIRTPQGLERDLAIEVASEGRITSVAPLGDRVSSRHFDGRALLPGFVNAHSHAFQRGLRGRGENFPRAAGQLNPDSFWTWREAMYGLVDSLDAERLHALCTCAFEEMLDAGITTVGEFHYVHHLDPAEAHAFDADQVVLDAARDVGLRIVLLQAFYERGGFDGRALAGGQRRFATPDLDAYWRQMDRLGEKLGPHQRLGVVAHSLRAVGLDELESLWQGALRRDLVMHLHLEEQRQEIQQAMDAHGKTPMALLNEALLASGDGARLTAVHCTHSVPPDLELFAEAGAGICICPLTEANLGDGLADLTTFSQLGIPLSLGSDSNARISMLEEMRWLEYGQRLGLEKRGVVTDAGGQAASRLLDIATVGGASSLNVEAGRLEAGAWADLIAVDLRHSLLRDPVLQGSGRHEPEQIEAAIVFGGSEQIIDAVAVAGRWLRG